MTGLNAAQKSRTGSACLTGKGRYYAIKRCIDVVASLVGLTVSLPIFLIIPILIKLDSHGPVFYKPERVTKGEKTFRQWKFRSMHKDADKRLNEVKHLNKEATGLIIRIPNDPRVTRIGRFLRKSSLDEVPQFINVLKGDMSLVGPRPPSVWEVNRYNGVQKKRLEVSPGLTGLWQISGRKDTDFSYMIQKDIEYVEKQGLLLDMKILLKTIPCVLWSKGAR